MPRFVVLGGSYVLFRSTIDDLLYGGKRSLTRTPCFPSHGFWATLFCLIWDELSVFSWTGLGLREFWHNTRELCLFCIVLLTLLAIMKMPRFVLTSSYQLTTNCFSEPGRTGYSVTGLGLWNRSRFQGLWIKHFRDEPTPKHACENQRSSYHFRLAVVVCSQFFCIQKNPNQVEFIFVK